MDFDSNGRAFHQWGPMVLEQDPALFKKMVFEKSPHGVHAAYRCSGITIPGNTKLAMGLDEKVLIETRGEGGYCLVAPSRGYAFERGDLTQLSDITAKERKILIECARACNEFQPKDIQRGYTTTAKTGGDLLPGQDFDERGDPRPYLIDAGWVCRGKDREGRERWARPGKVKGWSATLTENILYVFSTNGAPFEDQKAYSPFAVYTLLEHKGNFSEAAKELVKKGFGSRAAPEPATRAKPGSRRPKFLDTAAMKKEFQATSKMLYRNDLIPMAAPCLFGGQPGAGKSTDVAAICKEIVESNPGYWVLWVATEGFVGDHADKWQKLRMPSRVVMLSDNSGMYKLQLDNWRDRDFLDQSLGTLKQETGGQVVAVVIDSIRGMQGMGENDPKLAGVMSSINSIICDKHKASCVYIAHHKKGKEAIRLNRVSGGTGITSSVRAVYSVEKVSEYVCKIIPDKTNTLGHQPKTYRSILVEQNEGFDVSIVEDVDHADATKTNRAEKFLIEIFKKQSKYEAKEVYELGALENFGGSILKKAKNNLPIEVTNSGVGTPWFWTWSLYK